MAGNAHSSSTTSTRTTRRYWRRTETPRAWWPWGLLPIAGLLVLYLFGALVTAPAIERQVGDSVSETLENAGVDVTELAADGQGVTGRIVAGGPAEALLEALAANSTCTTWAGDLTCPASVSLEQDLLEPAPVEVAPRDHRFQFLRGVDTLILRGEVPSAAERERIDVLAHEHFEQVQNELRISDEAAGPHYARAADRAVAVVKHLVSGQASWSGGRLYVSGIAKAGDIVAARSEVDSAEDAGFLGRFDVQELESEPVREAPPAARQACNDAFQDTLSGATVRFRTASAEIDTASVALLQRLAALANGCSGNLTIEGHTDSQGDADMNEALSLARATAVRDALAVLGVDSSRMRAVGYGESRPIADNATAEGRARNRRIAISIDEFE